MSFFGRLKQQSRSVIEWKNPHSELLFSQWSDSGDEIKKASKLILTSGQGCLFIYQGQVKAVITEPCSINLQTNNTPFSTTIRQCMNSFEPEPKVRLFFFKTSKILNQPWRTMSANLCDDPIYKFSIGLHAFGHYSYQISNPEAFFIQLIGTQENFFMNDFKDIISTRMTHSMSVQNHFSYTEINENRNEIRIDLTRKFQSVFKKLKVMMSDFHIESIDFDENTSKRIHQITTKKQAIDDSHLQQLEAMRDAVRNEYGTVDFSVGVGIGFRQSMAQAFHNTQMQSPSLADDSISKLETLKKMVEAELMTKAEYSTKNQQALRSF
ncbi:MAG: SPFH domain-containing protein [Methylococcales bacterium]|nr:SPFH domain-containing protein [Methylococcales bacterium]MCK5925393.1 SPFH domain-containing protein [Methylococcales bacterium]